MFPSTPSTPSPLRPAAGSLRAAIRNAVDLTISFLTLESYGLNDPASALRHPGAPTDEEATRPNIAYGSRAGTALQEPLGLQAPLGLGHPHCRELRARTRPRRPGASIPQQQVCLMPVQGLTMPHPADARSPRPATAPQDAPR